MMRKVLFVLGLLCCQLVAVADEREDIIERIKPVGQVRIEGEEAKEAVQAPAPKKPQGPRSGEAIYSKYCVTCHAAGVAGAPKFHSADWDARKKQGIDTMLKHAVNGLNAMPPKGTCMDCSDAELKAAIEYMLPK